jgi:aryl-alcohol dehydrogenase-like predicted oxidoreductase
MRTRPLGRSDIAISELALGTAAWGTATDQDDAAQLLTRFVAAGGNLVDTADSYGRGRSEELIGRLLGRTVPRSSVILATKAGMIPGREYRVDASRGRLLQALDGSLQRLTTDYVDVWQVHAWDQATPLDETLEALETAVTSGRARCAGVSNYAGWQLAKAAASLRSRTPAMLASCQMEYSLLERGVEREVIPAALDARVDVLAWSPLGRGVLTGKYAGGIPADKASSWFFNWHVKPRLEDQKAPSIVMTAMQVADELGTSPQAVSLAWLRDRSAVAAAIVGARTADQLEPLLRADSLALSDEMRQRLDDVSAPYIAYPERPLLSDDRRATGTTFAGDGAPRR